MKGFEDMSRVLVVGPGAVGIALAYRLTLSSRYDVYLGVAERHLNYVGKGFEIEDPRGFESYFRPQRILLTDREVPRMEPFDVVILATKMHDLEKALAFVRNVVGIDTSVVTVQNGWNPHRVCVGVYGFRAVHAVLTMGVSKVGHNRLRIASFGEAYVGSLYGVTRYVVSASTVLKDAGMDVHIVEDVEPWIALKLIVNAAINALTAILRVPNGALLSEPLTKLLSDVVDETRIVVEKCFGISLPLNPVNAVIRVIEETASNRSSMLQDLEEGRKSEIDYLNCLVSEVAKGCGLEAKLNKALCIIVRWLEVAKGLRDGSDYGVDSFRR